MLDLDPYKQRLSNMRAYSPWARSAVLADFADLIREVERLCAEKQSTREAIQYRIEHEKKQTSNTSKYRVKLLEWVLSLEKE